MHLNYNKSKLHEQLINDRISKVHRTLSYAVDNQNDSSKYSTSNYNNPFSSTNYPFITPSTNKSKTNLIFSNHTTFKY